MPPLPSPVPTKLSILFWDAETENLFKLKVKIDKVCWFKLKKLHKTCGYWPKPFDMKHKPLENVHKLPKRA